MDKSKFCLGLYEKALPPFLSWREKLLCCRENGFDFLELSIDESDEKLDRLNWNAHEREALYLECSRIRVPISSICLSAHRRFSLGSNDAKIRNRAVEIAEQAIRLASDLGVRTVQLAGYDVYYEKSSVQTRVYFRENLRRCVETAARFGVILAFETMETPFMDTVEKAMRYVDEIASPYLQLYPDSGNLSNAAYLYGFDVQQDLQWGKGHIAALHLKESRPGVYRNLSYGEGSCPFHTIIQSAAALGVSRMVCEFWYLNETNWQKKVQRNAQTIQKVIEEVNERELLSRD